jgi:hypothetical protein
MIKGASLLSNLLLSSTLFWGLPVAATELPIVRIPAEAGNYCHMKFPAMREDILSWDRPVLDEASGNIVDFYGSCDYDPVGLDEINVQRRVMRRGIYEDGE